MDGKTSKVNVEWTSIESAKLSKTNVKVRWFPSEPCILVRSLFWTIGRPKWTLNGRPLNQRNATKRARLNMNVRGQIRIDHDPLSLTGRAVPTRVWLLDLRCNFQKRDVQRFGITVFDRILIRFLTVYLCTIID